LLINKPAKSEKTNPPKRPSTVFLGDTDGNNLCFPKFLPTKKANESLTQIIEIKLPEKIHKLQNY
jgi:hypothetical protein